MFEEESRVQCLAYAFLPVLEGTTSIKGFREAVRVRDGDHYLLHRVVPFRFTFPNDPSNQRIYFRHELRNHYQSEDEVLRAFRSNRATKWERTDRFCGFDLEEEWLAARRAYHEREAANKEAS